ncbi:MAG TPA: CHAT domain-containing protein, partial [Thermoanaerobaculia bacterium]|nr:CHAT domain-containing protein [Thermoanaerobaculia bacterium]
MSTRRKLLFISAGPLDHPQLRSGAELREITSRIREALPAERFAIEVETAAKRSELAHLLLFHKPEIVHFSGHGESKKGILLEDERGRAAAVDGKSLAALFSLLRGTLQTVVLNACSTKRIARELQKVVDYTIAMNGPIYDIAAVAF